MDSILPYDNLPRKRCINPDCQNPWLPATTEYFYFRNVTQNLNNQCKECVKRKANARYHQPEVRASVLAYSCLPEVRVRQRESDRKRSRRSDVIVARHISQREYRQRPEVREHKRDYTRAYYRRPGTHENLRAYQNEYARYISQRPEQQIRSRVNGHIRNARKKAIRGTHTAAQIQEQLKRQHYQCYYAACGFSKFPKVKGKYIFEIEHTFPMSRVVGTDIPANDMSYLVLACKKCNGSKGTKFPWEWPEGGRLL